MRRIDKLARGSVRCALVCAALAFSGCSLLTPQPEPQPEPVVHEPEVIIESPPPIAKPKTRIPDPVVPEAPPLPAVAIVLTSSQPAYADVAQELTRHLDKYEIYDLSDSTRPPVTVLRIINDSDSGAVVAIGLRAAQSSVAMSKKPVVFSQVFNYQDYDLVGENSRGVAAIPLIDAQFAAWKQVDPSLVRIGAIVGPGHDDLIAEAELAAVRHGLELRLQVSSSDQETLYLFKRMVLEIDGFWLLADNRILSGRVLQQIMDESQRHQVRVMVPSESMLQIGGSISISSVASDIAQAIADVIGQIQAGNLKEIPPISPLSAIHVITNDSIQVVDQ